MLVFKRTFMSYFTIVYLTAHCTMKAILSALAIVVLIATTHAARNYEYFAWLGAKISKPMFATAFNTGNIVEVGRKVTDGAVVFRVVRNGLNNSEYHPRCGPYLGFEFDEEETFCKLLLFGLKNMDDGSVVMFMHFLKYDGPNNFIEYGGPEKYGLLEIHISEPSGEEASPQYQEDTQNYFTFIDSNNLDYLNTQNVIPTSFPWLTDLLQHGLKSASPARLQGVKKYAERYVTRPVLLSPEYMTNLRSLL